MFFGFKIVTMFLATDFARRHFFAQVCTNSGRARAFLHVSAGLSDAEQNPLVGTLELSRPMPLRDFSVW